MEITMNEDYKPRFSFEITEEQKQRADRILNDHGMRRTMFSPILDDILDLLEQHGKVIYGLIADRKVKPRTVVPSLAQAASKAEKLR